MFIKNRRHSAVAMLPANAHRRLALATMSTIVMLAMSCPASSAEAQVARLSEQTLSFVSHAQSLIAITHVRVIDGTGARAKDNQTVLLRDGLIASVGRSTKVPKDATLINGSGHTLIPGLVGMHDHMFYPAPKINPEAKEAMYPEQASSFPKPYLAGGVTSIRTTGSTEPYTERRTVRWACVERRSCVIR